METGKPVLLANQGREPAARGPMTSLVARGMHYIRSFGGGEELFMLDSDPEERVDLASVSAAGEILQLFRNELRLLLQAR